MVNTFEPPISEILTWPKPNYTNPWDQGPALFACCIGFSIVGIFLVSARLYSRVFLTRAPGSDDILIVLGCIFTVALSAMIAVANKRYFNGRNIWDYPYLDVAGPHRLNVWVCEWLYLAAAASIKISILLFYRRLSVSFPKGFLIATWVGIAYNILMFVGFVVCLLTLCSPVEAFWQQYNITWTASHKFHCATEQVTLPLSGGLSMLGDLYATLLPMFMVKYAVRSARQKIGLYILFGLGFLSVVSGIIRTYLMYRLVNVDYNFLPPLYYMWIVTILELYFAIFAASAPALKPFFKKFVIVPVSKAKTSGARSINRSTTTKSPGPWSSSTPWSHVSSKDREGTVVDIEKIGIAHGFPEKIHPSTHTTWVEMKTTDNPQPITVPTRRYNKMISFPEERSSSMEEIAVVR